MKKLSWFLLIGLLLSGGCARHYVITLNDGSRISSRGKPELKGNSYVYESVTGKTAYVPAGGVSQIAPASMSKDKNAFYNSSSR